jgi:hypothetical protein
MKRNKGEIDFGLIILLTVLSIVVVMMILNVNQLNNPSYIELTLIHPLTNDSFKKISIKKDEISTVMWGDWGDIEKELPPYVTIVLKNGIIHRCLSDNKLVEALKADMFK